MHGLPKLDRIDINILSQLQRNGKFTNVTLADAVGLSPSPCLQRVKRLEKAGYIDRYAALINLRKLSDHVIVFTEVTLADHRRNDFIKFEAEIRKHPHVMECHLVSGGYDYIIKFIARSVPQYQEIMEVILERNIGVDKYFSYVVIKSVVSYNTIPLEEILGQE